MDEQYKTDIAILKNDLRQQVEVAEKIHTTLEKLGEISTNISRILAVHEEKINNQGVADKEIIALVETRREQYATDNKDLQLKISLLEKTFIDLVKRECEKIIDAMENDRKYTVEETKRLEKRINDLENWRWFIMGGSVIMGAFVRDIIGFLSN